MKLGYALLSAALLAAPVRAQTIVSGCADTPLRVETENYEGNMEIRHCCIASSGGIHLHTAELRYLSLSAKEKSTPLQNFLLENATGAIGINYLESACSGRRTKNGIEKAGPFDTCTEQQLEDALDLAVRELQQLARGAVKGLQDL